MRKLNLTYNNSELRRAVAGELEKTPEVISKTGIFANLDKLYGNKPGEGGDAEGGETTDRESVIRWRNVITIRW